MTDFNAANYSCIHSSIVLCLENDCENRTITVTRACMGWGIEDAGHHQLWILKSNLEGVRLGVDEAVV